jgi:diguanylate cyclase (GGDEF)-like protein
MSTYAFFSLAAVAALVPLLIGVLSSETRRSQHRHLLWFVIAAMAWGAVDSLRASDADLAQTLSALALIAYTWMLVQHYGFVSSFFADERKLRLPAYAVLAAVIALVVPPLAANGTGFAGAELGSWAGRGLLVFCLVPVALLVRSFFVLKRGTGSRGDACPRGRTVALMASASVMALSGIATISLWNTGVPVGPLGTMTVAFILSYAAIEHGLVDVRPTLKRGLAWTALGTFAAVSLGVLFVAAGHMRPETQDLTAVLTATGIALVVGAAVYHLRGTMSTLTRRGYWLGEADYDSAYDAGDDLEATGLQGDERRAYEEELSVVNRASMIITSTLDIQEMYNSLVDELKKLVDIDWAAISLIEDDEMQFLALASNVDSDCEVGDRIPTRGTAARWLVSHRRALIETDLAHERRFATDKQYLRQGIRSIAYLPLKVNDLVIGSFVLASGKPGAYKPRHIRIFQRLASQIAKQIEHSRLYIEAVQMARIDDLTGLFNRRALNETLESEIDRASRLDGNFTIVILDVDSMKLVNDNHGHLTGDTVLVQIGAVLKSAIRSTDIAFRHGGDEFAILLPQTSVEASREVAERVRRQISSVVDATGGQVTASFGLASWPVNGPAARDLLAAADKALYRAKREGGDRSCLDTETPPHAEAGIGPEDGPESVPSTVLSPGRR